jgi:ankyrin repeat protein
MTSSEAERDTALHAAAEEGDHGAVLSLLASGSPPALEKHADTPLMRAAPSGSSELLRLMLANGSAPTLNWRNAHGDTALHLASASDNSPAVHLLLAHGSLIELPNRHDETALVSAATNGSSSSARLLLQHGADLHQEIEGGSNPLHLAAVRGHAHTLRELIHHSRKQMVPVDAMTELRESPLTCASKSGSTECVKILLEHDASAQHGSTDARLCEPLLHATRACDYDAIAMLLEHRGGSDAKPFGHQLDGSTPVDVAARHQSDPRSVMALADRGAKPSFFVPLDECASLATARAVSLYGFGDDTNVHVGLRVVRTANGSLGDEPEKRLRHSPPEVRRALRFVLQCWQAERAPFGWLDQQLLVHLLKHVPTQKAAWERA